MCDIPSQVVKWPESGIFGPMAVPAKTTEMDRKIKFARLLASGSTAIEAAKAVGFQDPEQAAFRLVQDDAVLKASRRYYFASIMSGRNMRLAESTIEKLLTAPDIPAHVQLMAAERVYMYAGLDPRYGASVLDVVSSGQSSEVHTSEKLTLASLEAGIDTLVRMRNKLTEAETVIDITPNAQPERSLADLDI